MRINLCHDYLGSEASGTHGDSPSAVAKAADDDLLSGDEALRPVEDPVEC